MGRRSRDRSGSANGSNDGRRRRKRQPSEDRRRSPPARSRSASGRSPPRRRRGSPARQSGSPARGCLRSRSRSGPRRGRSRRRGRRRCGSRGRWQPSRSREGRDWSPAHRRGGRDDRKGPKPDGCRTIWVGWIDKKPDEEDLVDFFKDCGRVTEVRLSDRMVRGHFAHVQFEDTDSVDQAMKKAGEDFHGVRVQLDYAYMDKVVTNPRGNAEAPNSRRYKPKSSKPPNGHTLWVGDVSIDASEQDLIDLFESCGKIEMICLQVNQLRNGQFGHMKFIDSDAIDKAVELAGTAVKGVPIRLDYAEDKPMAAYRVGKDRDRGAPETTKPEGCRTVWVGGLPSDATEEMIVEMFSKCGEIKEVRLDRSKRSGTLFCHVEYAETTGVDRAVKLTGERLNSSKIRVDFAENRTNDGGPRRDMPPPGGMPPPGYPGMPPMGPPGAWMGPPPGYPGGPPPPGFPGGPPPPGYGPPPGYPGYPPPGYPPPPGWHMPPPRPSGAPGTEPATGPDGAPLPALPGPGGPPPPGWMGPPPGHGPPLDWRPPHGPDGHPHRPPHGGPPPHFDPWGPRGPPPLGYHGPPPHLDPYHHRPPGPDGGPPPPGYPSGPPPGYPGGYPNGPGVPPPGPSAAPAPAPGGPEAAGAKPQRSRSASYSSYSYSSYSVSPERAAAPK